MQIIADLLLTKKNFDFQLQTKNKDETDNEQLRTS